MSYTTTPKEAFYIIGIQCRTNYSEGQAQKDIAQLWNDWFAKGIQQQIPHRTADLIYNIYYDYASDHSGPYSVLLGCPVTHLEDIPEGMVGQQFEASTYARYDLEGPLPEIVLDCWKEIWAEQGYQRKFAADFDLYLPSDPANARVQTYVSIL